MCIINLAAHGSLRRSAPFPLLPLGWTSWAVSWGSSALSGPAPSWSSQLRALCSATGQLEEGGLWANTQVLLAVHCRDWNARERTKEKRPIWLTISEVLVYRGLPPCFGASSQAEGHRGRMRWNKAVRFIAAREGKGREGEGRGREGIHGAFPISPLVQAVE